MQKSYQKSQFPHFLRKWSESIRTALKNAESCSLVGHFGPISTFTNSSTGTTPFQGTGTPGVVLDYIYASDKVIILTHATEPGTVDGHFPSDHMPVIVDFIID